MKKKERSVSIRTLIIITFSAIIMMTLFFIGYIVFLNWYHLTNRNATIFANEIELEMDQRIDDFLRVPYHINQANEQLFTSELIDLDNTLVRDRFFLNVLDMHNEVIYSTAFATADGYYYGARTNVNNEYEIMKKDSTTEGRVNYYSIVNAYEADELVYQSNLYDPRIRDWYTTAVNEGEGSYSPIYKHFVLEKLTVTHALPIYNESEELLGVLANHVTLSKIDDFLNEMTNRIGASTFIFEKNTGYLIANSLDQSNFTYDIDLILIRKSFEDLAPKSIVEAYENYLITGESKLKFDGTGEPIYFNLFTYQEDNLDWIIVTQIPESFFLDDYYRIQSIVILVSIIIIVLSMFFYIKLTKLLFQPLDELVTVTDQISIGNFDVSVEKRRNDEVGRLAISFNQMTKTISTLFKDLENIVKKRTLDLEEAKDKIQRDEQKLRLILDSTAEGIYGIDIEGNCTFINKNALDILGYDNKNDIIGQNMHSLIHHHDADGNPISSDDCKIYKAMRDGKGDSSNNAVFFKKDQSYVQVRFASYPQYKDNEIIGAVISFIDNSIELKRQEEVMHLSYHDYLTGLYNRRYFVEELARIDKQQNYPLGIMMIDLNALKLYNDAFGHFAGDQALIVVARSLEKSARKQDLVCRLSGDEFALVMINATTHILDQIKADIKAELFEKNVEGIQINVAIGYAMKTDEKIFLDEILKQAENSMYRNKIAEGIILRKHAIDEIMQTLFDKHPYEKKHSEMVSHYSEKIGKLLNIKADELKELSIAAKYHDIGKISVPDAILDKPSSLTDAEYEVVKKHVEVGYQILRTADEYSDFALFALSHHENFDGTGYPKGLIGKEIPLFSRIIAVANAFENMTSNRPYRKRLSTKDAIQELMKFSGTQFDPCIVKVFIQKVLKIEI